MGPRKVGLGEGEYEPVLEVAGVGVIPYISEGPDAFIGPLEVAESAGLTSLRHALVAYAGATAPPPRRFVHPDTGEVFVIPSEVSFVRAEVLMVDVPVSKFVRRHSYEFVPEPVDIVLREGGDLAVRVQFVVEGDVEPNLGSFHTILQPLLRRTGAKVERLESIAEGETVFRTSAVVTSPDFWVVALYLSVPTHGRDVASALAIGRDVLATLEAAEQGRFSPASARTLVEANRADILIGHVEGSWLECKEQPYRNTEASRFELAKDVSALANSEHGGLILIGLRTRSRAGRDVITALHPVPVDERLPERYRKWIDHRLFPRPVDVLIRNIAHGPHTCIVMIYIPPQAPALRPFLVRGLLKDTKTLGTHLVVFTRRGDAVVATSAEELHSLLVAGRAALSYEALAGDAS